MNRSDLPNPPSRFANRWALFPVGLLGILVTVQVVLFRLSSGDSSFAIEPEYYQKAVNWDERMRERQASERLGWHADATITRGDNASLRVTLRDASGKPVDNATLSVDAFPNARAGEVQHLALQHTTAGVYESALRLIHAGEWEVRLVARTPSDTYTTTLRTSPQFVSR